ncbi:MAG: glycosyltransferase [Deltaproteobacteria bacterium]|nr:glycosyltransferase [Deltaproteobacteria bacterium]
MIPTASIVVLTYNNLDYTRQCLESVYAKTDTPDFELIVVDNVSTDPTRLYLETLAAEHPNCRVILNENNEGFARGNNIGAAAAIGKYLIFLNNDTVVTQGWLAGLIRHLQDPAIGMVGPVTNSSGNETRIAVDYDDIKDLDAFAKRHTETHAGQTFEVPMLPFLCVALRREVFESVGPLDERFGLGFFEDDDFALRLKEKGFQILGAEDVFIHHFGSASFSRLDNRAYWQLFKTNLHKLEEKWGFRWMPPTQRPELIPEQLRANLNAALFFTETIAGQEDRIAALRQHAAEAEAYVKQLNGQIKELESERNDLNRQLTDRIAAVNSLQKELDSNGWAFLLFMRRIRCFFVPVGSRREGVFRVFLRVIRNPRR